MKRIIKQLSSIHLIVDITVKVPAEATLRGHEYFFYDMAQNGGEAIVSSTDEISLYFKTRQATGMLFYTGQLNNNSCVTYG